MKKVIFSLALGTFGLGMAEFGIMGVLTELARDVGITIPAAGHMISFSAMSSLLVYGRLKHKQPSVTPVAG